MRWAVLLLAACGPDQHDPKLEPGCYDERWAIRGDPWVGEPLTFTNACEDAWWDFGDGTIAEGAEVTYHYAAPGRYEVTYGVGGSIYTRERSLLVTHAPVPRSHSAALAASEGTVWGVLPDFDAVFELDGGTLRHIDVCDEPRTLAVWGDRVAVACGGDQVGVLDGNRVEVHDLPRGSRPFGVAWLDAKTLVVTLRATGQVATVDVATGLEDLEEVAPDLRGIAVVDGETWVTRHRSPTSGGRVYQRTGGLPVVHRLAPAPGPDSDTDARGVPTYLQQIVPAPDGRWLAVGGLKANMARGLVRDGLAITHESAARSDLRLLGEEGTARVAFDNRDLVGAVAWSPRGEALVVAHLGAGVVDVLDRWSLQRIGGYQHVGIGLDGLATTASGHLYVLSSLTRELVRFQLEEASQANPSERRWDLTPPGGEVLDAQVLRGKRLFHAAGDPRMSTDAYLSCASCHLDGDQDARVWDFTDRGEGLRNTISLHGRAGTGHGPIHWSANFDEVQDFENDIRGPMQGRGFLSDADWAATQDTLGTAKTGLSADLDALAAYVESLDAFPKSPFRNSDGSMTADAVAGEGLFNGVAGCSSCHAAPDYTDSQWLAPGVPLLHDVGTLTAESGQRLGSTLTGLDTPTLRGVHATAPYLHDGSAPTLRAVLDANNGDAHGTTSTLTDAEKGQLVRFLLELE